MPESTIFSCASWFGQTFPRMRWHKSLLGMLASLTLVACGSAEDPSTPADSSLLTESGLVFANPHLKLERVNFGEKRNGSFYFENQSDHPVTIRRIGPATCGCTTLTLNLPDRPDFEPRELHGGQLYLEIAPGEKGELEVLFDTSRNRKPITTRTDAFAVVVEGFRGFLLQYSIDVWTPFWLEPWSVDLGRIGVRQKATGFASVKGLEASHFQLILPPEIDGWKFWAVPIAGTKIDSFNINFQAPDELPLGPFEVLLPIRTDLLDSPELSLSVRGIVVEDIDWSPRKIVLRPQTEGASAVLQLVNRVPELPIDLENVIISGFPPGLIEIQADVIEVGTLFKIHLWVKQPPSTRLEGKLLLRTTYQDRPHIEVPVVVLPRP
jgi:hypothetical protein